MTDLTLMCWRCHEPLDEMEAVTVPVHPNRPAVLGSSSVTKVHPECAEGDTTDA